MSDIQKRLDDLAAEREKLNRKLGETELVLDAVEHKIQDFKRRQEERMTRDIRVDDRLLKRHQEQADEKYRTKHD